MWRCMSGVRLELGRFRTEDQEFKTVQVQLYSEFKTNLGRMRRYLKKLKNNNNPPLKKKSVKNNKYIFKDIRRGI